MPEENENSIRPWLVKLLIFCLVISSAAAGIVGVIIMLAISDVRKDISDLRVDISAYHEYSQDVADDRRDDILEAINPP